MSLSYSNFTSTSGTPGTKKRVSTMKNAIKNISSLVSSPDDAAESCDSCSGSSYDHESSAQGPSENFQNLAPMSIEETQSSNDTHRKSVHELLNQINSYNATSENTGAKLHDFVPPPTPVMNMRKPDLSRGADFTPTDLMPKNPMQHPVPEIPKSRMGAFVSNDSRSSGLTNYANVYNAPRLLPAHVPRPYYSQMGIGDAPGFDSKSLERLNYMIRLLEDMKDEKTDNVTEEFILYSMLGVFMIFLVDSFTKSGKYVR